MKRIFIPILASALFGELSAQDISIYFGIIPDEQLIQIDPNRRQDMVDMFRAGKPASFANRLGGTSTMTDLRGDYLRIQVAENSVFEMKMLTLADSLQGGNQILAVIKTVCAPACDSDISFFTTTWQRLDTEEFFQAPSREDFLALSDSVSDREEILSLVNMDLFRYEFADGGSDIRLSQSYKDYLPVEMWEKLSAYIKTEPLIYRWNGKGFEK